MSCNPKIKAFVSMRNKVYFKALFSHNINLQTANFPCFKSPSSSWCIWVWISNGSLFFRSRSMFTSVTGCRGSHRTSHVVRVSSLPLFFTRHFVPRSESFTFRKSSPFGRRLFCPRRPLSEYYITRPFVNVHVRLNRSEFCSNKIVFHGRNWELLTNLTPLDPVTHCYWFDWCAIR